MVIGMAGYYHSLNLEPTLPEYTEFVSVDEYGYTRVHIPSTNVLEVEYISDITGEVRDRMKIIPRLMRCRACSLNSNSVMNAYMFGSMHW